MKSQRFIKVWEAEFISEIQPPVNVTKLAKCDCGECYALVFPLEDLIVCDACAEFYNDKKINQ
jgi:hypothetical protein